MVVEDSMTSEELRVIAHNLQRVKTTEEIFKESQYLLSLIPKQQGKRNDLVNEVDAGQAKNKKGSRYEKAADLMDGAASAQTIRRMNKVAEAEEKATEDGNTEYINLGLLDKMRSGEITPSHAEKLLDDYNRYNQERSEEKNTKITLKEPDPAKCTLYLKSSESLDEIETASVQTVTTSCPYFNARDYGNSTSDKVELGQEEKAELFIDNLMVHFREVYRVLKKEGSFFLNIGEYGIDKQSPLVTSKLLVRMCDEIGFKCVNEIIWHKTNGKPSPAKRRLGGSYEKVYHLVKDLKHYYYKPLKIWRDEPMVIQQGMKNRGMDGDSYSKVSIKRPYYHFKDFIDDQVFENVIKSGVANTSMFKKIDPDFDHPAPYDPKIPMLGILTTSRPGCGDIVLDIFSGTASTGEIALMLDRKYIGYEVNQQFHEFATKRIPFTTQGFDQESVEYFEQLKCD